MKKLIFLKHNDPNPNDLKMKKYDLSKLEEESILAAIKEFKKQIRDMTIQVKKENPTDCSVLIEFLDSQEEEVYEAFRKMAVVELIDSIIPKE